MIAATEAVTAATRSAMTRALSLRRSLRRALKSTILGRVGTPSAPAVSLSVLATMSSSGRRRASTNPSRPP